MNANYSLLIRNIFLLGMFAFCGCSYFDFDDESDYAPSVHDVAGCWVSTENLSAKVFVNKGTSSLPDYEDIEVFPSKTCMELCINEDSSFTYVSRIIGTDVYPDISLDLYGIVEPNSVDFLGSGGAKWDFYWYKDGAASGFVDDSKNKDFTFGAENKIRLIDGKLSGVELWHYKYGVDNYSSFYIEPQRKYSRTKDENACNGVNVKQGVGNEKAFIDIVASYTRFYK